MPEFTKKEVERAIANMKRYGSVPFFVKLAELIEDADKLHRERLIEAFPDYITEYSKIQPRPIQ